MRARDVTGPTRMIQSGPTARRTAAYLERAEARATTGPQGRNVRSKDKVS
jgi:hypothetical protein